MTEQHDAPEGAYTLADLDKLIEPSKAFLGPGQDDPTAPAPSGLVDAVRAHLAACDAVANMYAETLHLSSEEYAVEADRRMEAKRAARITLDATLSGQQGGAVPAGDLRTAQAVLAAWEKAHDLHLRAMTMLGEFSPLFVHREFSPEWLRLINEAEAEVERARLSEQPAPAETGVGGVEGLRVDVADVVARFENVDKNWGMSLTRLVDGISTYEARVDGQTREFDNTDDLYEWVGDMKRRGKERVLTEALALRAALDACSSEEGRHGPA